MTAGHSSIMARRRSKPLLTPPAANCTASLLHTVRASLRRGKKGRKLVWVIGNPGHNPATSHPQISRTKLSNNVHHHGHWTAAAYDSLKPPSTRRFRGAHPHLSYSMTLFASS